MYLAAHVYFNVLTVINIRLFCEDILHGRIDVKPPAGEGNPLCISSVDAGQTAGAQTVLFAGADVKGVLLPVCLAAQADIYMVKGNIGDIAGSVPVDHDSVFTGAVDIVKEYIADIADLRGGGSRQGGDGDRLRLAPEVFPGEQSGIDRQVGEGDIFDTTLIPKLQGDTAVGAADAAVADGDVAEGSLTLRAEFDCGAGGDQCTVVDNNVFTRAVLHCRSVVVGAVAKGTVVIYIVYHGSLLSARSCEKSC